MKTFWTVWLGQTVSLIGSSMTQFALGVWVYQKTGSVTQFAIISLFIFLPQILFSPIAGALVDRWNRRYCMIIGDFVAWLGTVFIAIMHFSHNLEIWHIYLAVGVNSIFQSLQTPAYTAAITQIVPKQNLARANAMVQATKAIAKLTSSVAAGFLVGIIQIEGILIFDCITFFVCMITLLIVRFPDISSKKPPNKQGSIQQILQETYSAWNYISVRKGLVGLITLLGVFHLSEGTLQVLFWPLVLSFATSEQLGIILSISGCGMLLGSILMSSWGGPKKRVNGILWFIPFQGVWLCMAGVQPSLILVGMGAFGYLFVHPIIISCNHTIWQSKIPQELQGRVFALQVMLEKSIAIIAYIITGPLIDDIFEPLMADNGLLANSVGKIIGTGEGRGMALFLILVGIVNIVTVAIASQNPRLRRVEKELPDVILKKKSVVISY